MGSMTDASGQEIVERKLKLIERVLGWLGSTPTTPLTIVVGMCLAILYVVWGLLADTLGRPLHEITLSTVGLFIASLVTAGVTQFGIKRYSDHRVQAMKHGVTPSSTEEGKP